jgi:hypothetical protein
MLIAVAAAVLFAAGCTRGHGSSGRITGTAATGSTHSIGPSEDRYGVQPRLRHRRLRARLHAVGCPQPGDHHPGRLHPAAKDCPTGSHSLSQTESVSPGPDGAWLVHYEIGGQQLTDYWFYVHRRWVFDLLLSNPDAVKLYRMSPQQYAAALGCTH